MDLNRDVISHIISYINDYKTIKNISLANLHLNQCARYSVKKIGGRFNHVPFQLASYLTNLEKGYFIAKDDSQFNHILTYGNKLKYVDIFLNNRGESSLKVFEQCFCSYGKLFQINPNISNTVIDLSYNYEKISLHHNTIKVTNRCSAEDYLKLVEVLNRYVPVKIVHLPVNCDASVCQYIATRLPDLEEINGFGGNIHSEIVLNLIDRVKAVKETSAIIDITQLKPSPILRKLNLLITGDQIEFVINLYPNLEEMTIWRPTERNPKVLDYYPQLKTVHINQYGLKCFDRFKGASTRLAINQKCENFTIYR